MKEWLEEENLMYVPILDAGIAVGDNPAC